MSTKLVAAELLPRLVEEDKSLAKKGPITPTERAIRYTAAMGNALEPGDAAMLAGHLVSTRTEGLTLEWCERAISEWAKTNALRSHSTAREGNKPK